MSVQINELVYLFLDQNLSKDFAIFRQDYSGLVLVWYHFGIHTKTQVSYEHQ